MKRFSLIVLLFFAVVLLKAENEVASDQTKECVCKEGEKNCKCPQLAQDAAKPIPKKVLEKKLIMLLSKHQRRLHSLRIK